MNKVSRAVRIGYNQAAPCNNLRATFFHSTSLRDRRRRSHGDSATGAQYSRGSAGFERILQSCQFDTSEWFTQDNHNGNRVIRRKGIWISPEAMQKMLQSGFGESQSSSSQQSSEKEEPKRSTSGNYNYQWTRFHNNSSSSFNFNSNKYNKNKRHQSSKDPDVSKSSWRLDRLTLGLSAYGPLRVEDVKIAYRACALKWHPDRHQGSSKGVAEEKFKLCCSAYESLCDKLGMGSIDR